MKVLFVFGTRPEAIKMAPIIKQMWQYPDIFDVQVCVTAQHREMLDQVLRLFNIQPDYDLDLMRPNQTLSNLTAQVFQSLDPIIAKEKPDWLLIQGDTTTVMAAGLVAYYHRVKVGHVEAGLRTHDKFQPFPEEANRRIASTVADLHFAPTTVARDNLVHEGIAEETIQVTGNTVIDALLEVVRRKYDFNNDPMTKIPFHKRIILVTAHRRENFGEPLQTICHALRIIAEEYAEEVQIVYPVHLNPNVRETVYTMLGNISNITLLEPLDYLTFAHLIEKSYLILTDSGGLQEEAPSLGKPVLVLRDTTERPEAIEAGTARLVGTKTERITQEVFHLLNCQTAYSQMAHAVNPYGDGHAAERICQLLSNF